MNFVDDVHLVTARHRRVLRGFEQLAHFINLGIGRRIDFQQIHKTTRVNIFAGRAYTARLGSDTAIAISAETIQRLRQNARERGLADAAGARE